MHSNQHVPARALFGKRIGRSDRARRRLHPAAEGEDGWFLIEHRLEQPLRGEAPAAGPTEVGLHEQVPGCLGARAADRIDHHEGVAISLLTHGHQLGPGRVDRRLQLFEVADRVGQLVPRSLQLL